MLNEATVQKDRDQKNDWASDQASDRLSDQVSDQVSAAYPPIGDYGVIGDCRTAALISRGGSIDWLCLPHFSGDPLFGALIDRNRGGRFALRPSGEFHASRRYLDDTNVLESRFTTATGAAQLTDCMPVHDGRNGQLEPQRELLRCIEGVAGEVEIEVVCDPRPQLGRHRLKPKRRGALGWAFVHRSLQLMLHSDIELEPAPDGCSLRGRLRLRAGERRWLSLTYVQRDIAIIPPLADAAEQRLQRTIDWWRAWSRRCPYRGPYQQAVRRSLLALKLLTYHLSGAVVAAPTTSLPEQIGGVRNWDYRFCWLRDAAMTFQAFAEMGHVAEAEAFLDWMLHATRLTWPELQVMYDVYGETRLTERTLDELEGYRGSRPVRLGNEAHSQLQLDTYGAVVAAADAYAAGGGCFDRYEARMLVGLGRCVCKLWRRPDKGIWEVRDQGRHNLHSKLMCWVALDRLVQLDEQQALPVRVPRRKFAAERDAIAASIEDEGFDEATGGYTGAYGYPYVDASLLLLTRYGLKRADDPRMLATWKRIDRELGDDGLIYRHRDGLDGLPPGEGAFVICSFWAVEYLTALGEVGQARERFEQLLACRNDLGLLAEEVDPTDGSLLGNFPQGFSHIGLIGAAIALRNAGVDDG